MIDGKEGVLGLRMEGIEDTEVPAHVRVAAASQTCRYLDELLGMCQRFRSSSLKRLIGKTFGNAVRSLLTASATSFFTSRIPSATEAFEWTF